MQHVIGCDVGTQALKVGLWREDGSLLGTETVEWPVSYPQPAWAEQDVSYWWKAIVEAIPRLYRRLDVSPDTIVAIGVDATIDGVVPVAEDGRPLAPHLLWMDRRAVEECEQIAAVIEPSRLFRISGSNLDATHTAAKILWLRNHLPEVYKRTWKMMSSATYTVYMLTGECVVDYANASSSLIFDVSSREWSEELLRLLDIDRDLLPAVRSATDIAGTLLPEVAEKIGLSPETLVVVGSGDEHASCVGAGGMEPGIVVDILGTAEPVCISTYEPLFDKTRLVETHCHAHPERWLLENPGFVSGGNYRWLRDTMYGGQSYEEMNAEAFNIPPGSEGLIFLPAMMGATAPEWNSKARGVFYGLTLAHTRGHLTRAVLEGAVYGLRSIVESMKETGLAVREIRAVAGGSRSKLVRQIRADALGIPVASLTTSETTVVGAALLAALGAGLHSDLEQVADITTQVAEVADPDLANRAVYDDAYGHFLTVYDSLKDSFEVNPFVGG